MSAHVHSNVIFPFNFMANSHLFCHNFTESVSEGGYMDTEREREKREVKSTGNVRTTESDGKSISDRIRVCKTVGQNCVSSTLKFTPNRKEKTTSV